MGPEVRYFTSEKELLAVVYIFKHFRSLLLGSEVIVITDHKALAFLQTSRLVSPRLTR